MADATPTPPAPPAPQDDNTPLIDLNAEKTAARTTVRQWLGTLPPWAHVLIWFGVVGLTLAINAYFGTQVVAPVPIPAIVGEPAPRAAPATAAGLGVNTEGWTPDADASDRDARQTAIRNFGETPAGRVGAAEIPAEMFLWQAETKLTGKPTPLKDQNPTGSCVGFGTTTGCERSLASDVVFRRGDPSEFAHFAEEVTYAGSKVQGARAIGASVSRQDGSAGVFVKAYFAAGYGLAPKGKYGSCDLTEYSASRARSWNLSGPPADVLEAGKKFPVKDVAKVTSWDQVKKSLASGYAITACASWSYARQRDANGVAAPTREGWNHCMCIDGYCTIGGREYGHVENSWSNIPGVGPYHTGPTGPGNPTTAGFWADASTLDRAVKQGDSYALSGVTGFPARKLPPLDWAVAPARRRDHFALTDPFGAQSCDRFALSP